jgi:prevent-host-death family protein
MKVNVLEAKTNFSKLLAAVSAGDEVLIANRGVPVARLVKYEAPKVLRKPGAWAHIKQPDGYDDFSSVSKEIGKQMAESDIFTGAIKRERQLKERAKKQAPKTSTKTKSRTK